MGLVKEGGARLTQSHLYGFGPTLFDLAMQVLCIKVIYVYGAMQVPEYINN